MMPKVTIVGNNETGVCNLGLPDCPHSRTGTNSSGSPTVFVNNKPVHRQGDSGSCNCPHGGVYTSTNGSSSVFVENKPITRIGDITTCDNCGQSGNHSTGSSNVFAGG